MGGAEGRPNDIASRGRLINRQKAHNTMMFVGHVFMTSSLVCLLLLLVILPVASNECSVPPPPPASFWRLESKTALVTGGTKGIGENMIAARHRNLHANLMVSFSIICLSLHMFVAKQIGAAIVTQVRWLKTTCLWHFQ